MVTGSARATRRGLRSARRVGRGFSLLELIAVLAILAVLSLSAGPVLSSVDANRQAHGAGTLRRDVAYARQAAVATGTRTWVVLDVGSDSYELYAEDPDNPGRANRTLMLDPADGEPFQVTLGLGAQLGATLTQVAIENDGVEVGFDYLGRPLLEDESAMTQDATITVSGSRTIVVAGVTGHVYQP